MRDLRGTWGQALCSLFGAVLLILSIRWAFIEPYVIPSGSMIPTLLVHDHIFVNKFSYGIRLPFTTEWLLRFAQPQRGDVIVFRSVEDASVFVVKRVIGLPGDEIRVAANGQLIINGKAIERRPVEEAEAAKLVETWPEQDRSDLLEKFAFFEEDLDGRKHIAIQERGDSLPDQEAVQGPYKVLPNSLFMMGDNRDNSSDSRVWGSLPIDRVLGRASLIWLSCEETLPEANQLCDVNTMRWERMPKGIQ